jgi:hypothetical protein
MARIPLTGPFSMSDINAEWELGFSLGVHRGAQTDIGFLPVAPNPISYSDFRGRAKAFVLDITFTTWQFNVNYRTLAVSLGWDQVVPLTMTIRNNSVIGSNSTAAYALDTDQGFPAGSVLNFRNNDAGNPDPIANGVGIVAGRGGIGGQGGSAVIFGGNTAGGNGNAGSPGGNGGPAMWARYPINIWNYGAIGGGGGGGGGSAGFASLIGGVLLNPPNTSGGGGGGGGGFGTAGPQNFTGSPPGAVGAAGNVGSWFYGGTGGASTQNFAGDIVYGGTGGFLGQSGSTGGPFTEVGFSGLGEPFGTPALGGPGGFGGRAVLGTGAIWQVTGTVLDAQNAPFFSTPANLGTYNKNQAFARVINAFDVDGDALNGFYSGEIPAGLTLTNRVDLQEAYLTGTVQNITDTSVASVPVSFNIGVADVRGGNRAQLFTYTVLNPDYIPPPPDPPPSGGSCFPGDATVLMANGLLKRIDQVQPGDYLVGGRGEINQVIALDPSPLGDRDLYVINGHHKTTSEHRHWTTVGWASINPLDTWAEHEVEFPVVYADGIRPRKMLKFVNGTPISTLGVGMTFDTLYGPVPFSTLTSEKAAGTMVYSLVMDGSHTFIVNGYTVSGWAHDVDFDYSTWTPRGE